MLMFLKYWFVDFDLNIILNKCLASSAIYNLKTKQETTETLNGSISALKRKTDRGYTNTTRTLL